MLKEYIMIIACISMSSLIMVYLYFDINKSITSHHIPCQSDFERLIADESLVLTIWDIVNNIFIQEVPVAKIYNEDEFFFIVFGMSNIKKI